jgi:uracil-DNA glycosylase
MYAAAISSDADETEFRTLARRCVAANLSPKQIAFVSPDEPSLLPVLPESPSGLSEMTVPRTYAQLLHDAICHRASDRFALLYDVLWRIVQGERNLVARASDPAIARLNDYAHNVRRDIHKMHAFLRFRARNVDGATLYTAWFEPQHFILRRAVPFFVDRFASMTWMIATPIGTVMWAEGALTYGPPVAKAPATDDSVLDDLWLTYYRTTFNPARLRVQAMTKEMPKHYWRNMPETVLIPGLVAGAAERVAEWMDSTPTSRRCSQSGSRGGGGQQLKFRARHLLSCARKRACVHAVPCMARRHRPFSERVPKTRGSCSSANNRATRKIWPGDHSSDRPARSSIRRWPRPASRVRLSTLQMR